MVCRAAQRRGQVDGGGGLSTTLLIGYGNNHGVSEILRRMRRDFNLVFAQVFRSRPLSHLWKAVCAGLSGNPSTVLAIR